MIPAPAASPSPRPSSVLPRLLAAGLAVVAIGLAMAFDQEALGWFRGKRSPGGKFLAEILSQGSDWPVLAGVSLVAIGIAWKLRGRRVIVILTLMLAATILAGAIVNPVRALTGRVRPNAREAKGWKGPWDNGKWVAGKHSRSSFPSAHTTVIAAFVTPLVLLRRRRRGVHAAWLLVVGVGWSRMYLGVHHLLDVVVGASVGIASGWFVAELSAARWLAWSFASRLCGLRGPIRITRPPPPPSSPAKLPVV